MRNAVCGWLLALLTAAAWGQSASGGIVAGGQVAPGTSQVVYLSTSQSGGTLGCPDTAVGVPVTCTLYYTVVSAPSVQLSSIAGPSGTNAADFGESNNCGTLPRTFTTGMGCSITITFDPLAQGTRTAQLTLTDSTPGSPYIINLTGNAIAACTPVSTLTPSALIFPSQPQGSSSAAQNISYQNSGNCPLPFYSIAVTGTNAGDFAQSNNCTSPLAAGSSCVIAVNFTPTESSGTDNASLTVVDSTGTSNVSLSGTAVAALAPATNFQPAVSNSWIRLYFTSSYFGTGQGQQASLAELTAYDQNGNPIPRTGWTAVSDSAASGNPASYAFDGNSGTFWLASTTLNLPHWVGASMANLTTTLTAASSNNTAACSTQAYCTAAFTGLGTNGSDTGIETTTPDPAPGNVSTVNIHNLLPSGSKVLAEMQGWFLTSGTSHTQTHYASSDSRYVAAAMNQMAAEHVDGLVLDWYGQGTTGDNTLLQVESNLAARCSSPQHCPVEFAAMIDQGYAKNQCAGATSGACVVTAVESALCYLNGTYFGNSAYLKQNPTSFAWAASTDPVVYTFPPSGGWNTSDWTSIASYANTQGWASKCPAGQQGSNGPVLLVTENSAGFAAPWNGGFAWPQPLSYSSSNQYLYDGSGSNYLENFYTAAVASRQDVGGAWKGFDDNNASWGTNRVIAQQCGQVLLNTLAKAPSGLVNLMLATWDDYEEGTETETGIDNCWRVNAPSFSGNTISWTLTKTDATYAAAATIDHFTIWYADANGNLGVAADNISNAATSYDLSTAQVPIGQAYTFYVQAVGAPLMMNQMSAGTTATLTAAASAQQMIGAALTVRQDGCDNGWPLAAEIDTAPDGATWTPAWSGSVSYPASTVFNCPGASSPGAIFLPLTPGSKQFADQVQGTTSAAQAITLTNTGGAVLTVTLPATVSGDFALASTTCTGTLAPGASCVFNVTFTPSALGLRVGALTLSDNAASSPQVVPLWGNGIEGAGPIAFVQANNGATLSGASVSVSYASAQQVGDLNVVVVGWNDTTATIQSVSDTNGQSYRLAAGPTKGTNLTQAVYYAYNIQAAAAGANRVTVTWNQSPSVPDVRILEYSGIKAASDPFDSASGSTGSSTSASSGGVLSSTNNDLLVGGTTTAAAVSSPGSNFTQRIYAAATGDDAEDRFLVTTGTYLMQPTISPSGNWVSQLAAFKGSAASAPPVFYSLTVSVTGGPGTVTGNGTPAINCQWSGSGYSGTCSGNYLKNQVITLAATPGSGDSFLNFIGGGCSASPCLVLMAGPQSVTANFSTTSPTFYISGCSAIPCNVANEYVGNDANSGTAAVTPVLTWNKALSLAKAAGAGAVILAEPGDMTSAGSGYANINCASTGNFISGTSAAPMVIQAEYERQTNIRGDGTAEPLQINNCNWISLIGFEITNGDFSGEPDGLANSGASNLYINTSSNILVQRNVFQKDNRYFNAMLAFDWYSTVTYKWNEFYYFHRHAIDSSFATGNVYQENYFNSRNYADIPGGRPSEACCTDRGDSAISLYPAQKIVAVDNISEGNEDLYNIEATQSNGTCPQNGGTGNLANNNSFYGGISLNDNYGGILQHARGTVAADGPVGTSYLDIVSIIAAPRGPSTSWARSPVSANAASGGTTMNRMSFFGMSTNPTGGNLIVDQDTCNSGGGTYLFNISNSLAAGAGAAYGFEIDNGAGGTWSGTASYLNSFGNGINFAIGAAITQSHLTQTNPNLGSCWVYIPSTSPLHGAGANGSDIGADMIFEHDLNGNVTTNKLWNTANNPPTFAGQGAFTRDGVNNVAGSSEYDVATRLHVGAANGCALPY